MKPSELAKLGLSINEFWEARAAMTLNANSDMAEMLEMLVRVSMPDSLRVLWEGRESTQEQVDALRAHVTKLRLTGDLREELCHKVLDRCAIREAQLQASPNGATTSSTTAPFGDHPDV